MANAKILRLFKISDFDNILDLCNIIYYYFPYCCFRFVQTVIFTFQVNPGEEEKEAQEDLEAIKEVKVKELNQPIQSGLVLSPPQRRPLVIPIKIAIIEKIVRGGRWEKAFPSCSARALLFTLPRLPTTQRDLRGGETS